MWNCVFLLPIWRISLWISAHCSSKCKPCQGTSHLQIRSTRSLKTDIRWIHGSSSLRGKLQTSHVDFTRYWNYKSYVIGSKKFRKPVRSHHVACVWPPCSSPVCLGFHGWKWILLELERNWNDKTTQWSTCVQSFRHWYFCSCFNCPFRTTKCCICAACGILRYLVALHAGSSNRGQAILQHNKIATS